MRRATATAAALLAAGADGLAGCGSTRRTINRGGRVVGDHAERLLAAAGAGGGRGRDVVDAEKLALRRTLDGTAAQFAVNFISIDEGAPGGA